MEKLTVAKMKDLEKQVLKGDISYSRMIEIINEPIIKLKEKLETVNQCWLDEIKLRGKNLVEINSLKAADASKEEPKGLEELKQKWTKELKTIGNFYNPTDGSGEYKKVTADDLKAWSLGAVYGKMIPLTEEWLIKFFNIHRRNGNNWLFDFSENFTCMWDGERILIEEYSEGEFPLKHIKYVHQLQNLYFALTGQELTLKQPSIPQ